MMTAYSVSQPFEAEEAERSRELVYVCLFPLLLPLGIAIIVIKDKAVLLENAIAHGLMQVYSPSHPASKSEEDGDAGFGAGLVARPHLDTEDKMRRLLTRGVDGNTTELGEIERDSDNPLMSALHWFSENLDDFLASTDDIVLNRFPRDAADRYVNGLTGRYRLDKTYVFGSGTDEEQSFHRRVPGEDPMRWVIRWDYDENEEGGKGPHVNTAFGNFRPIKYAWKLRPGAPQYSDQGPDFSMQQILTKMLDITGFSPLENEGRVTPRWGMGSPWLSWP